MRELERAFLSGGAPAVGRHPSPYQWGNACHYLWEAGRIDIAEYAARHLHAIYSDLPYLATLVALFDAMPRDAPAPLAFCDDPTAEIQIIRRPGCQNLLLCFCAAEGTLGLPLNFVHQWLGRLPASLIYIKDFRDFSGGCGYPTLGPDRATAITAFRRIGDEVGAENIYTLGVSLGGYAALYYGLELQAVAALSLGGATDYTPEFVLSLGTITQKYHELWLRASDYTRSLRDFYASASQRPYVLLAYSSGQPSDRRQAERFAGLPNVELIAVNYAEHNVLDPLIRRKKFMPLLHRLFSRLI